MLSSKIFWNHYSENGNNLIATAVRTCKEFTPYAEITVYAVNSSIEKLLEMLVLPEGLHPENTIRQFKI